MSDKLIMSVRVDIVSRVLLHIMLLAREIQKVNSRTYIPSRKIEWLADIIRPETNVKINDFIDWLDTEEEKKLYSDMFDIPYQAPELKP